MLNNPKFISDRNVDVYQRAGQGDLDKNDLSSWMLETGDDIDRPDIHGLSMMMWAAAYGQVIDGNGFFV